MFCVVVVVDQEVLCISLLDGFLCLYVVCIYVDDEDAVAMSNCVVVDDIKAAFVVANLVGGASLLWVPPLEMHSLSI